MNMDVIYIMAAFIFVYGIISSAQNKRKQRENISKEAFKRLQDRSYKKELEQIINHSQDDAFNIAALRKQYFLTYKDAKKLWEILKNSK